MKVLITGASGFVGRKIATGLFAENFTITGLARSKSDSYFEGDFICADISLKDELLNKAGKCRFDSVIHCAGLAHQFGRITRENFEKTNVEGTRNILELAYSTQVRHFILISSTAVYGSTGKIFDEESVCRPETVYAETKLEAENICRKFCSEKGISLTIFRLAPVLGGKGIGNVPRLIEAIYKKRFIWIGKGGNKKTLIYVGDVALACMELLRRKKTIIRDFQSGRRAG